jgi:hypothetical protein
MYKDMKLIYNVL